MSTTRLMLAQPRSTNGRQLRGQIGTSLAAYR